MVQGNGLDGSRMEDAGEKMSLEEVKARFETMMADLAVKDPDAFGEFTKVGIKDNVISSADGELFELRIDKKTLPKIEHADIKISRILDDAGFSERMEDFGFTIFMPRSYFEKGGSVKEDEGMSLGAVNECFRNMMIAIRKINPEFCYRKLTKVGIKDNVISCADGELFEFKIDQENLPEGFVYFVKGVLQDAGLSVRSEQNGCTVFIPKSYLIKFRDSADKGGRPAFVPRTYLLNGEPVIGDTVGFDDEDLPLDASDVFGTGLPDDPSLTTDDLSGISKEYRGEVRLILVIADGIINEDKADKANEEQV